MRINGKRRALCLAMTGLVACGGGTPVYVNERNGQQLLFVSDTHVRWLGNYRDREWLYEADRGSDGRIMAVTIRNPQVGTRRFRQGDDGCLMGERDEGRFCPR